jgi:hydrogenase maturation protease
LTSSAEKRVLVFGIGNPAREDDGLGPAAANIIEQTAIPGVTVDADYQLTVEGAAQVAEYDAVVYIDASVDGIEPFSFSVVEPERENSFSSHSVRPPGVVALARDLFNAYTDTYILGIRGYSFEMFTETMTVKAQENLRYSVEFLIPVLKAQNFQEVLTKQF